jgi:transposase
MQTRRKFTAAYKTKVVHEALSERLTLSETAEKYRIHADQIGAWNRLFLSYDDTYWLSGTAKKKQIRNKNRIAHDFFVLH